MSELSDRERARKLSETLAEVMDDPERRVQVISEFTHAGRQCVVTMAREWNYCGYVEAPEALTSMTTEQLRLEGITAYGAITYQDSGDSQTYLSEIAPEAPGWLGFDCAHAFDLCLDEEGEPLPVAQYDLQAKYWRGEYDSEFHTQVWQPDDVANECRKLAEAISAWEQDNE